MKNVFIRAWLCGLSLSLLATPTPVSAQTPAASGQIQLLDASLSQWEVFVGVPHFSVTGLPEGTFQSKDVTQGTSLGLNNDPEKVFTTFTPIKAFPADIAAKAELTIDDKPRDN